MKNQINATCNPTTIWQSTERHLWPVHFCVSCCVLATALGMALPAFAEDWPTYMHDPTRSGVSGETLTLPLAELWAYVPPTEPKPAWPDPQVGWSELPKLKFDDAFHVAMAGDAVYFGSSVDHGVHALDAATGARRWTIFTEGPVRLAPTVAGGRVYAGSDDGAVYCVDAKDGRLAWSMRPMPGTTRILGAGRLMSLWPVRTDVLVDGGVAYCGAGIFPARGTALVALDAASGKQLWKASQIPKESYVTLSPQGYLLASAEQVYVPCGRTAPLTYARKDGTLRGSMVKSYDVVAGKGLVSGDYGVLIDDRLYLGTQNVLHGYRPDGKHVDSWNGTRQLVATSNRYYRLTGQPPPKYGRETEEKMCVVTAIDRKAFDAAGRKNPVPREVVQWTYAGAKLQSIIVAGSHVAVGGSNEVIFLDAATGKEVWRSKVDGLASGLAVANGRLVVSTDKGRIHCFGKGAPAAIAAKTAVDPFASDAAAARTATLAEAIAKDAGIERGYGLVIGGDGARLAYDLARRTGLLFHVAETDPAKAATAREALSVAGAYGTKVVVNTVPSAGTNSLPYPPYFANVVVVDGAALGAGPVTAREVLRMLKPCGGVLYAGVKTPDEAWSKAGAMTEARLTGAEGWTKLVRGRLPGARDWTHQYADAGNTSSSDDERVRGKPEILWYGEPGPDKMQDRHRRSEAPLSLDGRVFVQGLQVRGNTPLLLSFDAYNGVPYWERTLPGAERLDITGDCGNLACSPQGLFVATNKQCQRLDLATGESRATYALPARTNGSTGAWAYVAVEGDTLIGSSSSANQFSDAIFACDIKTGQLKWRYEGAVIRNSTIAVQGNKVFFVEHRGQVKPPIVLGPIAKAKAAEAKRRGAAAAKAKAEEGEGHDGEVDPDEPVPAKDGLADRSAAPVKPVKAVPEPYLRTVVALDLATGKQAWAREVNLAGCGNWMGSLCLVAKQDVILLCGVYSAYGRTRGDEDTRRAMALSAKDGAPLWDSAIGNRVRPVVVGDRVIGRPHAFNLLTGAPVMRGSAERPIPWRIDSAGACGQMSASAGMLFYRHGVAMMMDVRTGGALMAVTGMRPGCLINIIPAGGVITQVEGSSGCTCYHALQATVTFVPPGAE